ncbi:MAG: amidohydrolase family protein [Lachnospiraceae bacterium]|nr:amidohydrolase family protein [Lachnospiraceae bacterium]
MTSNFVLKGGVITSRDLHHLDSWEDAYVVCVNGLCEGVFEELPDKYKDLPLMDLTGKIIMPGLTDLHTHAPQYNFHGIQNDLELLDWLNTYTFPEESKFSDPEYAERSYDIFVENMYMSATTRAVVFASIHVPATHILMELMEESGIVSYVGKVNMDRNSPDSLIETTEGSLKATREWLADCNYDHTYPILTPRFTPTCSDELMRGLKKIADEYGLAMQSHLSENKNEIAWIAELQPETHFTAEAFSEFGLFGLEVPTVMAHCVWSSEEEVQLMKRNGVYVAHCPESNMNLSSGIAPIRHYLDEGVHVGLATDGQACGSFSMFDAIKMAVQASKMYNVLVDSSKKALTFDEAFYLASEGGGSFFGRVGAFKSGYEFDAVVIDDELMETMRETNVRDRVERMVYHGDDRQVVSKFVRGCMIY